MPLKRSTHSMRINSEIRSSEIRLIDEKGVSLGVMKMFEAMRVAEERSLDLVEVSSDGNCSTCKLMDYSKFKYTEQKKRMAQKRQKSSVMKEIQLRPRVEEHDYQVKLRRAETFLQQKNKVRLVLQFRGREMFYQDQGYEKCKRFIDDLAEVGKVESPPKKEGKRIFVTLVPV